MNIEKVLKSGGVLRYHATPEIPCQTLADHQWRVGLLLQHFYPTMGKHVLIACLTHDCAEMLTGDAPTYAKQAQPALKILLDKMENDIVTDWGIKCNLENNEKKALKFCDVLEGLFYCHEQVMSGNRAAKPIFFNWVAYYESLKDGEYYQHQAVVKEKVQEVNHVR